MAEQPKSGAREELPIVDVNERAGHHTGNPQVLDTRPVHAAAGVRLRAERRAARGDRALGRGSCERARAKAVLYADVNAPRGLGVLTLERGPRALRAAHVGPALACARRRRGSRSGRSSPCSGARTRPATSRTCAYSCSIARSRPCSNERWPWAIWYPLRRSGRVQPARGSRASGDPERARHDRPRLRRAGSRARHPAGVLRPRRPRQRLRDRPGRQGAASALARGASRCARRARRRSSSRRWGRSSSATSRAV